MSSRVLGAALIFAHERRYRAIRRDAFRYSFFQRLVIDQAGDAPPTRSADQRPARPASLLTSVRVWMDVAEPDPKGDPADLLDARGLAGKRPGVGADAHDITVRLGRGDDAGRTAPDRRNMRRAALRALARIAAPMRRAALACLFLATPALADDAGITFWDGAALRTAPDPHAVLPALHTERQKLGTLIARDVGLFVEPASDAPAYVSNLIAGALVRRLAGHVALHRALGAGRVFTIEPHVVAARGRVAVNWRLFTEEGEEIGAFLAAARMSGAPRAGHPFAGFTPEDAERIAFQTAARLEEAPFVADAIRAAQTLTRLDRTPTPPARPETQSAAATVAPESPATPEED